MFDQDTGQTVRHYWPGADTVADLTADSRAACGAPVRITRPVGPVVDCHHCARIMGDTDHHDRWRNVAARVMRTWTFTDPDVEHIVEEAWWCAGDTWYDLYESGVAPARAVNLIRTRALSVLN